MSQDPSSAAMRPVSKALREGAIVLAESIEVPWFLLEGHEDMIKRRTEIISPAWDSAADDLRRFGHAELETLTQKLDKRCTDLQEKAQTSKDRMIFHRFALHAFKAIVVQHGQDTPIIRAVYPLSGIYLNGWIGGGIGERESAGPSWVTYSPDPKALKEVGIQDAAHLDAISDVYEFESRHTWQDGIDRATAGLGESKEQYLQTTRTIAALRFRLSILRNVLWQYECFGQVATWKEIHEADGLSAEGLHHERTLKIGSALLDYFQQHGAFPENDFEGSKMNFYEWAGGHIGTSSGVVILALNATDCLIRGTRGKRGDELIATLERTVAYAQLHSPHEF